MKQRGNATALICDSCGREVDLATPINLCPHCGGLLEVQYDINGLKKSAAVFKEYRRDSIWRYRDFMPFVDEKNIVTLGEGGTPLVKSKYLGPSLGIENLYFKNDTLMPTGSFKDRGFSLAVSYALDIGVKRGLTYSSGNAGASFAAYGSRADFPGVIMVEYQANPVKKAMIMLYGAKTAVLEFDNFLQIETMLNKAVEELGCYMFVNFINPIRHEAMKTYAYEIYSELGRVPDFSFHPMGTGGGVWGTWKGYKELADIGLIDRLPHMIPVQPKEVCWLKQAIDSGDEEGKMYGDSTKTIAQSISGNSPLQGGRRLIKTVKESDGEAMAVTDEEIMSAMLDLGKEGIAAEPSSAAAVAAFKQAAKAGKIASNQAAVCVITGSALKQPSVVQRIVAPPEYTIKADVVELQGFLHTLHLL